MSKIKIYKNRYGKEPIVVGEMKETKPTMSSGLIFCPYIPLIMTPVVEKVTIWKRMRYKFEWWFYEICHRHYKSDYISECLQDLYENFGSEYLIMLQSYTNKKVNKEFYSKIDISSDAES